MNRILFLILFSGFCAGTVYPLIKIADSNAIPKFAYIFWESLIITCLLIGFSILRRQRSLLKITEGPYYLFCAFTNIIIPQTLYFLIAAHLSASLIGVVIVLTPMLVYLSLIIFFKEPFVKHRFYGVLLGLIGAALLFLPNVSSAGIALNWPWLALAILLPVDYCLNRIFVSKLRPPESSSMTLAIGLFASVAIMSCALMFGTSQFYHPFRYPGMGELALFSHALLMSIFYVIFFVLAQVSAVHNSLSFYVTPLVAMSWGVLFFEERIGAVFCIAAILVFSGLYLVNKVEITSE